MPRGDGTGPMGQGPMTGRGLGYCAGSPNPGFMNPGPSFGRGLGRGWGRGFGRGFRWRQFNRPFYRYPVQPAYPVEPVRYPVEPIRLTKEDQRRILEQEKRELELDIKAIQEELNAIGKKLKELK